MLRHGSIFHGLRRDVKLRILAIMARRAIEIGAVGRRVAENLTRLRERRRLSQEALAGLVQRLGRPMSGPVVSKTEQLDRRVDVDDLVALAVALGVSPNRVLLPEVGDLSRREPDLVDLAPAVRVTAVDAWRWAAGDAPLPGGDGSPRDEAGFAMMNRPHCFARLARPVSGRGHPKHAAARALIPLVERAVAEGMAGWELREMFETALVQAMMRKSWVLLPEKPGTGAGGGG
jgi:transcriptional regulator with XRE-family HTH domain